MKRSLVHLAALAAMGAARSQSTVCLHGSPSTELSLEGLREHGYTEDQIREVGQRRIAEAVKRQLAEMERVMTVPREMLLP